MPMPISTHTHILTYACIKLCYNRSVAASDDPLSSADTAANSDIRGRPVTGRRSQRTNSRRLTTTVRRQTQPNAMPQPVPYRLASPIYHTDQLLVPPSGHVYKPSISPSYLPNKQTTPPDSATNQRLAPPSDLLREGCIWPESYVCLSVVSALLFPLTGLIAIYCSLRTRQAVREGYYALSVERSKNTLALVTYTFIQALVGICLAAICAVLVSGYTNVFSRISSPR